MRKTFSDSEGKNETTLKDVTIPIKDHELDSDGKCSMCKQYFVETAENMEKGLNDTECTTVTLKNSITLKNTITLGSNKTLDLNSKTITGDNVRAFHIVKGEIVIKNGTIKTLASEAEDGRIDKSSSVIRVGTNEGTETNTVKLTIADNVVIEGPDTYGVTVFGSKTTETVVLNGTINSLLSGISGNGTSTYGGTTITVNEGAKITATDSVGIYHPQAGTLTINGGEIKGLGGIEMKGGTLELNGGEVTATANENHESNNNGTSTEGYALAAVSNNGGYAGNAKITVTGGTVNGIVAKILDSGDETATIVVQGGSFSADPASFVDANNYNVSENAGRFVVTAKN